MRARVAPTARHSIDRVAPGAEGTFPDNAATRAMIEAGLLLPLEELPAAPPPRARRAPPVSPSEFRRVEEDFNRAWREVVRREDVALARVQELEEENACLRARCNAAAPEAAPEVSPEAKPEGAKPKSKKGE